MKLREWLDLECVEIKQLASKLGVSRHSVHNWLSGTRQPLRVHKALIQKITKGLIKIGDWENGVDRRVRSSKEDGVQTAQRMDADKKAKPQVKKA